jgi:hypothetical protein
MRFLRKWLAIAMALVYLPVSGYCLLETAGFATPVECCAESSSQDHGEQGPCGGYGCCPIEYAAYSNSDSGVADLATPPAVVFFTVVLLSELPTEATAVRLERLLPDNLKSWQFSFRTALPPRAPSFVS